MINSFVTALHRFESGINNLKGSARRYFFAICLLAMLPFYLYGALNHLHNRNTDYRKVDQSAYMEIVYHLHETDFRYIGDFNRVPLYPHLQSLHYDPHDSYTAFFERGKLLNVGLSIGLLFGLFLIYQRYLPNLATLNLMLFTTFLLFVFKAGYFQAELLFYLFVFLVYLLCLRLLVHPAWWTAAALGILAGIGHLTKGSIIGALLLFAAIFLLQTGFAYRRGQIDRRRAGYNLLCLALIFVFYIAVIFPYINAVERITGHYFYNVNTSFYMWYDSWHEVREGTRLHGDRVGYPDMPAEDIPGPLWYLRHNSPPDMFKRFVGGVAWIVKANTKGESYGYFWYFVVMLALPGALTLHLWRSGHAGALWQRIQRYAFPALFIVGYFVMYYLLYAFYTHITAAPRFVLSLFVPLAFTLMWVLSLPEFQQSKFRGLRVTALFQSLLFFVLTLHSLYIVFERVMEVPGGR